MAFLDKEGLSHLWTHIISKLNGKVDKEEGKGLSSNDYTNTEKLKLSGIESNANNYVHPKTHSVDMITGLASVATSGSYNDLSNKPTIPTIPDSLPANGGNADTVDGKHATDFADVSHTHSYAGSSTVGGAANSAVKLDTARTINGVSFDGSKNIIVPIKSTLLSNSQNLDDIKTVGFYYAGGSNTVTNKPSSVDAFGLEVIQSASGWYTQILYASNNVMKSYRRWYNGSTWTSWTEDNLTDTHYSGRKTNTNGVNGCTIYLEYWKFGKIVICNTGILSVGTDGSPNFTPENSYTYENMIPYLPASNYYFAIYGSESMVTGTPSLIYELKSNSNAITVKALESNVFIGTFVYYTNE